MNVTCIIHLSSTFVKFAERKCNYLCCLADTLMYTMYGSSQFTYLLSSKSGEFRYFIVWLIRFQHLYCKILRGLLAIINSTFIKAHCSFFHHSLHVSHVAHSLSSVIPEFLNFLVQLPGIIIRHFASRDIIYQIGQFLAYPMPISLRIDKNTGYAIIQHQR